MFTITTWNLIVHLLCYNISWFAGILLVASGHLIFALVIMSSIIALQLTWQVGVMKNTCNLWFFILITMLGSTIVDSFCIRMQWLLFAQNPWKSITPPWMMLMWLEFAVLFYGALYHWRKRYWTLGALSLIGFSLAYSAGVKLGAAHLVHPWGPYCWGLAWGAALPFCLWIFNQKIGE